jgi:hypothetical protein
MNHDLIVLGQTLGKVGKESRLFLREKESRDLKKTLATDPFTKSRMLGQLSQNRYKQESKNVHFFPQTRIEEDLRFLEGVF